MGDLAVDIKVFSPILTEKCHFNVLWRISLIFIEFILSFVINFSFPRFMGRFCYFFLSIGIMMVQITCITAPLWNSFLGVAT